MAEKPINARVLHVHPELDLSLWEPGNTLLEFNGMIVSIDTGQAAPVPGPRKFPSVAVGAVEHRAPPTQILGPIDRAERLEKPPQRQEYRRKMSRPAQHLKHITIEKVLDVFLAHPGPLLATEIASRVGLSRKDQQGRQKIWRIVEQLTRDRQLERMPHSGDQQGNSKRFDYALAPQPAKRQEAANVAADAGEG